MPVQKANRSCSTEEIISYYQDGHTIKECSERFGLHSETIRLRFRKVGINDGRKRHKVIDEEVIEYYKSGHTIRQCCSKFHLSSNKLSKVLDHKGIKRGRSEISKALWQDSNYVNKTLANNVWNENRRAKTSENSKRLWSQESFRNQISSVMKEKWDNEEYRKRTINKFKHEQNRNKISKKCKESLAKPEIREKIINNAVNKWRGITYRERMASIRSSQRVVSPIQEILYSILDDLNIEYYREYEDRLNDPETIIGPYNFDCMIPLKDRKLLIECQGDYWHSLDKSASCDKAKATYIEKYHADYELKYIWEHEFSERDRIIELVKYWTGMAELEIFDFDFNDVEIKKCKAKDYKMLLSKYHYLPNAGRGGMAHGSFGAYMDSKLVAVCVFSPLVRQNLPWPSDTTRELSRLCIHPRYQKKNFASWFVSRCIKMLDHKYNKIISYCDTTFNHDGAVYKACNFKEDGAVRPDYWYASENGWIKHKKTLYENAKKFGMSESEYAAKHGYKKVYGKEKLRFIYDR